MDGTRQVMLVASATDTPVGSLVVRFTGKKLDVYVITSDIVDDENASIRIKFDDEAPVRQTWNRSTDYKAVFSPRPFELLKMMRTSHKFYLEYQPYQRVPDTIAFSLDGLSDVLPSAEMAALDKKDDDERAADAALRARILPYVHECSRLDSHGWCWSDPDSPVYSGDHYEGSVGYPFRTKEQALADAKHAARMGVYFKTQQN
jgi:hypothetical protein